MIIFLHRLILYLVNLDKKSKNQILKDKKYDYLDIDKVLSLTLSGSRMVEQQASPLCLPLKEDYTERLLVGWNVFMTYFPTPVSPDQFENWQLLLPWRPRSLPRCWRLWRKKVLCGGQRGEQALTFGDWLGILCCPYYALVVSRCVVVFIKVCEVHWRTFGRDLWQ